MRRRITIGFLAGALLLAQCTGIQAPPKDQVLAKVNGQSLHLKDFLVHFEQLKAEQDEISRKNPKLMEQIKLQALNEVIITVLLQQEAAKKKMRVPKEEIEGRLADWKEGYPPGGFEEMLKRQNTTEDFLKTRIGDQLLVEKLTNELFSAETRVSDDEMKKYFTLHQHEFVRPERSHVFQIVVPTKEEAEKIRQLILSGKQTFESAARQFSLSPDAANGGDLGFFSKNEKIAVFNESFALSVGTLSKPLQSRYGFHLLKVVEKQSAKKLSYAEAKDDIVKALRQLKEGKIYKEWVTKLLKDGEIYRNDALFEKIT